jgi:gamma-tubulin complex component 5
MLLSRTPTQATVAQAYEYLDDIQNPLAPPKSTTWQDIFASEPLEGQHWQGAYGLPPGSVHKEWSEEEEGSSGSEISSASSISFELGERDVRIEIDSASSAGPSEAGGRWSTVDQEPSFIQTTRDRVTHRRVVEELQSRQYWRPEWKYNLPHERKFDMGDASTLGMCTVMLSIRGYSDVHSGPSTQRALGDPLGLVSVGAHQQA